MNKPKNFEAFVKRYPQGTQTLLRMLRLAIRKAVPQATERISYGMPAFFLKRNLVYFNGYRHHIGFYPGALAIVKFKKEISRFKSAKGSVQFPLDKPLPLALVTRIVKFRVKQDSKKK